MQQALNTLNIDGDYDDAILQKAYITAVKTAYQGDDFESKLKDFNVSRDFLVTELSKSKELIHRSANEISEIRARELEVVNRKEARADLGLVFARTKAIAVTSNKQSRDLAIWATIISGGLGFFQQNIADLFPDLLLPNYVSAVLLVSTSVFAAIAFFINNRTKVMSTKIDSEYNKLTQSRRIERILNRIFDDQDVLDEFTFEWKTEYALAPNARFRNTKGYRKYIQFFWKFWDSHLSTDVKFDREFRDDYVEFLISGGHVDTTGSSGKDLVFSRPNVTKLR